MTEIFWGVLIPFISTAPRAGCVFFMKKEPGRNFRRVLTGFAGRVMTAASVRSLIIPEMSAGEHSNIGVQLFAVGSTLMIAPDAALG